MRFRDPLRLSDWNIHTFVIIVFSIHIAVMGMAALQLINIHVPIISTILVFAYLCFIPGFVALRALGIHNRGRIFTPLAAIGLSLLTVMFSGLAVTLLFPMLGMRRPFDTIPLLLSLTLILLFLMGVAWSRRRRPVEEPYIDSAEVLRPSVLLLFLLPFMAIFGALFMNWWGSNIVLMLLFIVIGVLVVLFALDYAPPRLIPLAILSIALSLVLHKSLISDYLTGWDIQHEFWIASQVLINHSWDPSLPFHTNAMMSITVLAPTFSILSGLDLVWIFKIIYPILFAIVPVALYYAFRKQTTEKIAFLSCFFFMAFFVFYGEMLAVARQEIAELFLALALVILVELTKNNKKYLLLFLLFSVGIIISHYGISFILLLSIIIARSVLTIINRFAQLKAKDERFLRHMPFLGRGVFARQIDVVALSWSYLIFFAIFLFAWSILFSSASIFDAVVSIARSVLTTFIGLLTSSGGHGITNVVSATSSPLSDLLKVMQLVTMAFISISVFHVIWKWGRLHWNKEFVALALAGFAICLFALVVPAFANSLNTTRVYHIALIFLAPFCVHGALLSFKYVTGIFRAQKSEQFSRTSFGILAVFFAFFLLLNAGVIHEVTGDHSISIALDPKGDNLVYGQADVTGGLWLKVDHPVNETVYADHNRWILLNGIDWWNSIEVPANPSAMPSGSLLFMGQYDVMTQQLTVNQGSATISLVAVDARPIIEPSSRIYSSGQVELYRLA
jgi:uncharacterized membrane protein